MPYLLALPLLPIWVFTALGQADLRLSFLYPLGALAAIGIHFAQALPDTTLVLPGHGPATTMERERATNPYLQGLAA